VTSQYFDKFNRDTVWPQEQSDRNFFLSCKTSKQVIGRSWKEVSLSSGKPSINLRRASTGFAVALVTSSEVDAKKALKTSGSTVSGGALGISGYHYFSQKLILFCFGF